MKKNKVGLHFYRGKKEGSNGLNVWIVRTHQKPSAQIKSTTPATLPFSQLSPKSFNHDAATSEATTTVASIAAEVGWNGSAPSTCFDILKGEFLWVKKGKDGNKSFTSVEYERERERKEKVPKGFKFKLWGEIWRNSSADVYFGFINSS